MTRETVAIAADHAGFELKSALAEELAEMGYEVLDLGTTGLDSVDYPDFANALARAIGLGNAARGLLVCGSGIGMSIAANRHTTIRAALCHDETSARLARQHNDANVLVLPGRFIAPDAATRCLHAFMETGFEGGRHARRVAKLGEPPEDWTRTGAQ
jgi:ribose 5-phosphate isomerase B